MVSISRRGSGWALASTRWHGGRLSSGTPSQDFSVDEASADRFCCGWIRGGAPRRRVGRQADHMGGYRVAGYLAAIAAHTAQEGKSPWSHRSLIVIRLTVAALQHAT